MRLSTFPSLNVIRILRGVVDFYYWKGIPIARRWPRDPRQPNTPAQEKTKSNFVLMHQLMRNSPPGWKESFARLSIPVHRSLEDLRRKIVLTMLNNTTNTELFIVTGFWCNPPLPAADTTVFVTVRPSSGVDFTQVEFMYRTFLTTTTNIKWIVRQFIASRELFPKEEVQIDWTGWALAPDLTWVPESNSYEFPLQTSDPYVAVIPRWKD